MSDKVRCLKCGWVVDRDRARKVHVGAASRTGGVICQQCAAKLRKLGKWSRPEPAEDE